VSALTTDLHSACAQRDLTTEQFKEHFGQFGEMEDAVVVADANKVSRGFGFVTYVRECCTEKALVVKHMLFGKEVDCKRAVPKGEEGGMEGGAGGAGGPAPRMMQRPDGGYMPGGPGGPPAGGYARPNSGYGGGMRGGNWGGYSGSAGAAGGYAPYGGYSGNASGGYASDKGNEYGQAAWAGGYGDNNRAGGYGGAPGGAASGGYGPGGYGYSGAGSEYASQGAYSGASAQQARYGGASDAGYGGQGGYGAAAAPQSGYGSGGPASGYGPGGGSYNGRATAPSPVNGMGAPPDVRSSSAAAEVTRGYTRLQWHRNVAVLT
jgi:hypothetical protein